MNKENYENRKLFKKIKGIMVIQGKHLSYYRDANKNNRVLIKTKPYNWRVSKKTYHINRAKVGHLANVVNKSNKTKKNKARVVITKIIHATGPASIKMAKKLKPVINFQPKHYENHRIIKDNTSQLKPNKHLTPAQKKRAKAQQEARKLVKKMPKTEVAEKLNVSVMTIYNWLKK